MKIHFDNVFFNSQSGPNSFGTRLANQFKKMGHQVVCENESYDIFLSFIHQRNRSSLGSKKVLRLDGIWFKPENFEENNTTIKQSYFSFDHVIFQSEFDKKMVETHFGLRSDCSVIHNGIELEKKEPILKLCHKNEMIFVCSASWHRQKRLKENIELFDIIRSQLKQKGKDARLYVLGQNADFSGITIDKFENVFYLGQQRHEDCLQIYATADYFLHLAWLDHCPNVVVEALSQGCPVICTDSGGTHEIVKNNGIIIPETQKYSFELTDYDSPYPINLEEFKLPEERPIVEPFHLSIEEVAQKYLKAFKNNGTN
jgi:glycosyltransferase involved in cell wall biosynthesis